MRLHTTSASRGGAVCACSAATTINVGVIGYSRCLARRPVGLRLNRSRVQVLADHVEYDDKDAQLQKELVRRISQVSVTHGQDVAQYGSRQDSRTWVHLPGISISGSHGLHVEARPLPEAVQTTPDPQQLPSTSGRHSEDLPDFNLQGHGPHHFGNQQQTSNAAVDSEVAALQHGLSLETSAHSTLHDPSTAASASTQEQHHNPGSSMPTGKSIPTIPTSSSSSSTTDSSAAASDVPGQRQLVPGIPHPILIISLVSASLTMASCVFNTLLPIYLVTELKMTMQSMGMFEGLLEAFSYIVRMFSGVVSDMMTSRKSAITVGFAMGAMAKFGMSGATEVGSIFASKAIDRLANGVQAAPRDAMISDLAPEESRSSCFGFAQSMRKWGSAVGAVLVFFLMKASGNNYKLIFTMAATLSLASCAAFVMFVPSHARPQQPQEKQQQQQQQAAAGSSPEGKAAVAAKPKGFNLVQFCRDVASMGSDFYRMLLIVSMYGMGHISEALLESRAIEVGFGKAESTLIVASLAFVTFMAAYPLGRLDDKFGPRVTFAVGMAALMAGDLILLLSGTHPWAVFASLLFMGVHMGVIQGPLLSIVVGLAPDHLRGTAFGIFYTVMAITAIGANTVFGTVWHAFGATSAFAFGAAMTGVTLFALPWLLPKGAQGPKQQQQTMPAPA